DTRMFSVSTWSGSYLLPRSHRKRAQQPLCQQPEALVFLLFDLFTGLLIARPFPPLVLRPGRHGLLPTRSPTLGAKDGAKALLSSYLPNHAPPEGTHRPMRRCRV